MQSDAVHAADAAVPCAQATGAAALLMFRLGDFYELFYEDAVTAARELEITLTARNKEKGRAIPMCGVPHHSSEGYIAQTDPERISRSHMRADGGSALHEETGEARDCPYHHARDCDRTEPAALA